jgi:uncharacterized Zn-binding protein involved in type VI secretion
MPKVCRVDLDQHFGHASPTPNPFHRTSYAEGSPNVFATSKNVVRIGDKTYCTDPAVEGSSKVFANSKRVHRIGDATGGHQSWVPNFASTGCGNVFAGG